MLKRALKLSFFDAAGRHTARKLEAANAQTGIETRWLSATRRSHSRPS